jgi:hypothetical protein
VSGGGRHGAVGTGLDLDDSAEGNDRQSCGGRLAAKMTTAVADVERRQQQQQQQQPAPAALPVHTPEELRAALAVVMQV